MTVRPLPNSKKKYIMTDARILRRHFKIRAEERYGIFINMHMYFAILNAIRFNKAEDGIIVTYLNDVVSMNRAVYLVCAYGRSMVVVYDRARHELVTDLPYESWQEFAQGKENIDLSREMGLEEIKNEYYDYVRKLRRQRRDLGFSKW